MVTVESKTLLVVEVFLCGLRPHWVKAELERKVHEAVVLARRHLAQDGGRKPFLEEGKE